MLLKVTASFSFHSAVLPKLFSSCMFLGLQTNFCVRIMNRSTSSKTLIKNFLFNICDLAFASHSNNILGAIDVMGNFSIWELRNKGGSTLEYTILWSIKNHDKVSANCHR